MEQKYGFHGMSGMTEQEKRRAERKKKWEDRSKRFWKSLLFMEDGKPKSGFVIYTFCLSLVFLGVYIGAYGLIIDWLAPVTESWPPVLGNLLGALCASAAGILIGYILHRLLPDKRLMLGTHVWLALYLAASIITMAVILRGTGAMKTFMVFALWFGIIPVALGILVFWLLTRRDHHVKAPEEEEPEWKKYVRRSR